MAPEYVTVYQISRQSADWSFALAGGIPLIIGIVIILGKRRFRWEQPNWFLPIFACGFGGFWICTAGLSVLYEDSQALTAYRNGDFQLVEGIVTDFHPMPYEGHQEECFSVQDKRFCYSDYVIASGFRNTASHGGPIRSGLLVRIAYSGDAILRLDIPRDKVLGPTESAAALNSEQQGWRKRTESDPVAQRINIAFMFTAVCWTLWWNLQWQRVMRFWVRPPNRPRVQYLFRAFFALNFLGASWQFVKQLHAHPLSKQDVGPTLEIAVIMCAAVSLMSASVLWMAQRRDRKANDKMLTRG
jgi:hypothetical protein